MKDITAINPGKMFQFILNIVPIAPKLSRRTTDLTGLYTTPPFTHSEVMIQLQFIAFRSFTFDNFPVIDPILRYLLLPASVFQLQ